MSPLTIKLSFETKHGPCTLWPGLPPPGWWLLTGLCRSRSQFLDRSGSMTGKPLELAKQACSGIVRNLPPDDVFSVIVFDDAAQVVIPLQKPVDRQGMAD